MKTSARQPPDECANCGAGIPRSAKSCPECGADERTGWRESSIYDGLDLPAEAWTDDREASPPTSRNPRINGVPWYWWIVGALLLALLIIGAFGLR